MTLYNLSLCIIELVTFLYCHPQASCGTCPHATRWRWPSSVTLWPHWPTRSSSPTRAGAASRTATNTKSSSSRPCCCATPPAVWGEEQNKRTPLLMPHLLSLNISVNHNACCWCLLIFITPLKPLKPTQTHSHFIKKTDSTKCLASWACGGARRAVSSLNRFSLMKCNDDFWIYWSCLLLLTDDSVKAQRTITVT